MPDSIDNSKGVLAWFAGNPVAANLLMFLFIVIGIISLNTITVEVMPEFELDTITVSTPYPGASPDEVEAGVLTRLEDAIDGTEGIKKMRSIASEGSGTIVIEVSEDADTTKVRDEVEAAVGRVSTLPKETERPVVSEIDTIKQVINVVLFGDVPERVLKTLAEQTRDELTAFDNISQAQVVGARSDEISINVSETALRKHNLTLEAVSLAISRASLDLPAGSIKTNGGEILLRTQGQRYQGRAFEDIVLISDPDGTKVHLGDVADVRDAFEDTDLATRFDGTPAVMVRVFRVGKQGALDVVDTVKEYVESRSATLPKGVRIDTWQDDSELLRSRLSLLVRNAGAGLALVFLGLALFLDLRLAFWTMAAIPMAFLGSFAIMQNGDITINMISLFGLIIVLGIVVDDAIVVGENVFAHRQAGKSPKEAAILGIQEMAVPVTFAILTSIAAFAPILFVDGVIGKFLAQIPVVVISVLVISLIDALFVLPAHLAHSKHKEKKGPIARLQAKLDRGLQWVINKPYGWLIDRALRFRYVTLGGAIGLLLLTFGLIGGGHVKFEFLPEIDSDNVVASLVMPQGTPKEQTQVMVERLEKAAEQLRQEYDTKLGFDKTRGNGEAVNETADGENAKPTSVVRHVFTAIGEQPTTKEQSGNRSGWGGAHLAEVNLQLLEGEERGISSSELADRWRAILGEMPGVSSLSFTSSLFSAGEDINIELSHQNEAVLIAAADKLKKAIAKYPGTRDVDDSFEPGKLEYRFELTDEGRTLGVTLEMLAIQARHAFYGAEAQRIQRGRDEVKVMVRFPADQRESVVDIESMRFNLRDGTEVPFSKVARLKEGRGYAAINRTDRRRVITVTADVDENITNANEVNQALIADVLPGLKRDYAGLAYAFEGQRKEQIESMTSLASNFFVGMFLIYGLLPIPFKSYTQPLLVMSAIPFGVVGAVIGHLIMGYDLSLMSSFGIVALAGVVVNDSLIIIDLINRQSKGGMPLIDNLLSCGKRRFRPIMLTTLTTFFGLMPMIFETSLQARFLIPMTLSLGFGVLFATGITLILVPVLYLILEDIKALIAIMLGKADDNEELTHGNVTQAPVLIAQT